MGMFYHFLDDEDVKLVAVEAAGKGVDSGHSAATSVLGREGIFAQQSYHFNADR